MRKKMGLLAAGLLLGGVGAAAIGWIGDPTFGRIFAVTTGFVFAVFFGSFCYFWVLYARAVRAAGSADEQDPQPKTSTTPFAGVVRRALIYFALLGGVTLATAAAGLLARAPAKLPSLNAGSLSVLFWALACDLAVAFAAAGAQEAWSRRRS